MANDWTEEKMQNALTRRGNLFDFRRYAVVPNVSYALFEGSETDLLCLTQSGVFHEVEIKVSKSDLVADRKKPHGHENPIVAYTWFAVPEFLGSDALNLLPERYGLVVVDEFDGFHGPIHTTRVVRPAKKWQQFGSRKPTDAEIIKFLRTGVIRMWTRRTGDV